MAKGTPQASIKQTKKCDSYLVCTHINKEFQKPIVIIVNSRILRSMSLFIFSSSVESVDDVTQLGEQQLQTDDSLRARPREKTQTNRGMLR